MIRKIPLKIDITDAIQWPEGFPEKVELAITVCLPDQSEIADKPVAMFCFPGGGYSRHYYDLALSHIPGCENESYSQIDHHLANGIIVVTCDHLCVGESTVPQKPELITMELLTAANAFMVEAIKEGLVNGSLIDDVPPLENLLSVGLGQSMGGGITLATQADHACFDAIAVLGYGVYGSLPVRMEDIEELYEDGDDLPFVDQGNPDEWPSMLELWFQSDVPQAIIDEDIQGGYPIRQTAPVYGSLTLPPCAVDFISPGFLESRAKVISAPVLIGYGDRDVLAEPEREPSAFSSAVSIAVTEIPMMGHMHNFASSRKRLWDTLVEWIGGVVL